MATIQQQRPPVLEQLKAYLDRAIDVSDQWSAWLTDYQQALLTGEILELETHAARAKELFGLLHELGSSRGELLRNASEAGITVRDAKALSRSVSNSIGAESLRAKLRLAEQHMARLRRLARATWILVSQCARMTDETLMLMTLGQPEASVYIASPMADNRGGFLLDKEA